MTSRITRTATHANALHNAKQVGDLLTVRELARLKGFDEGTVFQGSDLRAQSDRPINDGW
jgi:site-specific DNA-cytosine methylase